MPNDLDLPSIAIDHQEEWRRTVVENGQTAHHTAMVDVATGGYVLVGYDVLAQLLGALGFARVDDITADSPTWQGDPDE